MPLPAVADRKSASNKDYVIEIAGLFLGLGLSVPKAVPNRDKRTTSGAGRQSGYVSFASTVALHEHALDVGEAAQMKSGKQKGCQTAEILTGSGPAFDRHAPPPIAPRSAAHR